MAQNGPTSLSAFLARVFWIMLGPMALLLLTFGIVTTKQAWTNAPSVVFLIVLLFMPVSRWFEYSQGGATSATGEAVTAAQVRNYSIGLLIMGAAVWAASNILSPYSGS